jgi:hypothetical protein
LRHKLQLLLDADERRIEGIFEGKPIAGHAARSGDAPKNETLLCAYESDVFLAHNSPVECIGHRTWLALSLGTASQQPQANWIKRRALRRP